MQQVNLTDQLYQESKRRAAEAGFASVDDYIADVLSNDFQLATEDLDHFFTPERLALVDQAAADVAAGNSYTAEQAKEALARSREAWQRNQASGK